LVLLVQALMLRCLLTLDLLLRGLVLLLRIGL